MTPALSIFLDLLRVVAALGVLAEHAHRLGFLDLRLPESFGHRWVVVFFVLSGLVITHSATGKQISPRDYVVARLSRLSSVVVPALLLTAAVDLLLFWFKPEYYQSYARSHGWFRYVLSFFCLNEVWFVSACPPANAPFWSIGYEFWYYVLFGVALFIKSGALRWTTLAVISLLIGPKIILLLPIWLMGVGLCGVLKKAQPRPAMAVVFWAFLALFLVFVYFPLPNPLAGRFREGYAPLFYSAHFLSDYQLGLIVTGLIFTFAVAFPKINCPEGVAKAIRVGADYTFSCYLYHYPLMVLAGGLAGPQQANSGAAILLMCLVIAGIFSLGYFTEQRRRSWRRWIDRLFQPASIPAAATHPAS